MSEEKTKPKRKKRYKVSPMGVNVKKCVEQIIIVRGRQVIYEKWLFQSQDFPCPVCGRPDDVRFMRHMLGVYRSCKFCNFSEKVEPRNIRGVAKAYQLESKVISAQEARKILSSDKIGRMTRLRWAPKSLRGRGVRARNRPSLEGLETE